MTSLVRPSRGGFSGIACAVFIRDFLAGKGPHGSPVMDPEKGSTQADIKSAYRDAVMRVMARDNAEREISKRTLAGETIPSEQAAEIEQYYLSLIPSKLTSARYHSFLSYFGLMKRLGWVKEVSQERSGPQDYHDNFQPRRYYRLTAKCRAATVVELSDPIMTLYKYPREIRSAKRRKYYAR